MNSEFKMVALINPAEKFSTAAQEKGPKYGPAFLEMGLVLAGGLAVAILLLVWAVFFRKSKRNYDREPKFAILEEDEPEDRSERRRMKHRRRRRGHRPRNPTLAETGGLPPIRETDAGLP